jgi:hypothetical protein
MGKANPAVQVPGAPADLTLADGPTSEAAPAVDEKDAEIARLRAQLAATVPAPSASMVVEADTPHGRLAMARSQHKHLTSAELDAQVRAGEVKLTDHHVLCKDGWYVNPEANVRANG